MNCPDITVKCVIKDESEWNEFSDALCRSYGFENVHCPLVYCIEGKLIGDGNAFMNHVKDCYNKSLPFNKEASKARARLMTEENQKAMSKKRDGDSFGEQVEQALEKVKKSSALELLDDSFYELKFEEGIPLYVRQSNFLRQE
jgi:hypothetical protein